MFCCPQITCASKIVGHHCWNKSCKETRNSGLSILSRNMERQPPVYIAALLKIEDPVRFFVSHPDCSKPDCFQHENILLSCQFVDNKDEIKSFVIVVVGGTTPCQQSPDIREELF